MKFEVTILQKRKTVNPADKAIKDALCAMGYNMVTAVRLGKYLMIETNGSLPVERLKQACGDVNLNLVNPVMEDFKIEEVR